MTTYKAAESRARRDGGGRDAPLRGLSIAWPMTLLTLVLYGSLIPFNIDFTRFHLSNGLGLLGIEWFEAPREDLVTNLLVYLPIGLSFVICGRLLRARRLTRVLLAVLAGMSVSVLAETLQTGIAARVASWTDVALNATGTAVGAILGVGLFDFAMLIVRRLRDRLTERPFATGVWVLTLGLLLYGLAPFDFVTDTAGLHASLLRADWSLDSLAGAAPGAPPYLALADKLRWAGWFALLGYLHVLSGRASGRHPALAWASAAKQGTILVVVIELMQLLTRSHRFELSTIALGILATVVGAWCATAVIEWSPGSAWRRQPRAAIPTVVLAAVGAYQLALLVAAAMGREFAPPGPLGLSAVHWIPFEAVWRRPMHSAGLSIGSAMATYGALAITLAILLRRRHIALAWLITGGAMTLMVVALEALQVFTVSRTPDATPPAIALLATVLVARTYSAVRYGAPLGATASVR